MAGSIHRKPQQTSGASGNFKPKTVKAAPGLPSQYAVQGNDVKPEVTSAGTVHKKATHYRVSK